MSLVNTLKNLVKQRDELPLPVACTIRGLFVVAALAVAFYVVEGAWRQDFGDFQWEFLLPNLLLYGLVLAVVYLLGQRSRGALLAYVAVFFVVGVAYHFVFRFKGQPILPADLMAAGTAAAVGDAYSYDIDEMLWRTIAIFSVYAVALIALCPRRRLTIRQHAFATGAGALALAVAVAFFSAFDLDENFGFTVENWAPGYSFAQYGTFMGFAALAQDVSVPVPAGYSAQRAQDILAQAQQESSSTPAADSLAADGVRPAVVVIMNETFSDLSDLAEDDGSAFAVPNCRRIMGEALASGTALTSVFGGGTCNSEFEFLTGTSMAFQNSGYYPYMFQNFQAPQTLPRYFAQLGYETCAMHPNLASNWQRDRVYPQMGFDQFLAIDDFSDAPLVRGEVRDCAVYDAVLKKVADAESPQFIFAITMANHSGYTNDVEEELLDPYFSDSSTTEGLSAEEAVYAHLIRLSDADLGAFVDQLEALVRPVVLCFFGDHQPTVSEGLFSAACGVSLEDARKSGDLELLARAYEVPYFIWGNSAMRQAFSGEELSRQTGPTSLCYLGSQTAAAAGLPLAPFMSLALSVRGQFPLFNAFGYEQAGEWSAWNPSDRQPAALNDYAVASYYQLYDAA